MNEAIRNLDAKAVLKHSFDKTDANLETSLKVDPRKVLHSSYSLDQTNLIM